MNTRINAFGNLTDPPIFTPKPKKEKPVEEETIARIAEDNNFVSRQLVKSAKAARRKSRTYRTGRNQQFNAKATPETIERFYKIADDKDVRLGELLEHALDALDAVDSLQKLANKRGIALNEVVMQALVALDSAGGGTETR